MFILYVSLELTSILITDNITMLRYSRDNLEVRQSPVLRRTIGQRPADNKRDFLLLEFPECDQISVDDRLVYLDKWFRSRIDLFRALSNHPGFFVSSHKRYCAMKRVDDLSVYIANDHARRFNLFYIMRTQLGVIFRNDVLSHIGVQLL